MHAALSSSRLQAPKTALRATYSPDTGRVRVRHPRGTHFRTMGAAVKKEDVDARAGEGGGGAGVVMLKEEEALYLVERGALELRFEAKRGEDDDTRVEDEDEDGDEDEEKKRRREKEEMRNDKIDETGIPMSVQAAYAFLIGAGQGLTLERFIVYSGLKRSGYIVLRAPGWDGEEEHGAGAGGKKKMNGAQMQQQQQHPLGWFWRIYAALWHSLALGRRHHHHGAGAGPLVGLGVYRSYSQYCLYPINSFSAHTDKCFGFGS